MAMRCFGRAFLAGLAFAAATPLAFDLMVLRAEDLAAVLWPDHFFFTAGCAAARDATFFLAMGASFFVYGERLTQNFFVGWGKRRVPDITIGVSACLHGARARLPTLRHLNQCSLNTPSTARSSAGLINLECATVTENSGPSSFACQKERKSLSAGNFGNRS